MTPALGLRRGVGPVASPSTREEIAMSEYTAIDCDIHPGVPDIKALLPYMSDSGASPSSIAASTAST